MTSWTTFVCDKPDFTVRSAVDGSLFPTSKAALGKSEVFRDMFTCCDPLSTEGEDSLELHETSGELTALLRLLHEPPPNPSELAQDDLFRPISYDPKTVVPLPILISVLFPLADKYAIEESVVEGLKKHLAANAPQHPLEVYGFASANGMEWEASTASQFVQPLASYSLAQVTRTILSVPAYHRLHKLQDNRVKELHRLLLQEEIFPNGYGVCASHGEKTRSLWDRQRKGMLGRIDSASDIGGEMGLLTERFQDCPICHKAWLAAVDMLRYKAYRVPRRLDQLSNAQ